MGHHVHLTLSEREDIMLMRREGKGVQEVYDKLNRRPRKRLGYRTPYEVHYSETLHLI